MCAGRIEIVINIQRSNETAKLLCTSLEPGKNMLHSDVGHMTSGAEKTKDYASS